MLASEVQKIIEDARKEEFEYCKEHKEYFIEHYIHIEDVDNKENIIQLFKLWESQKEVLNSIDNNRLNIVLKARQLGITWLVLAYCVYLMLFNVGYLIIALSKTEEDAKELIRRITVMLSHMQMFIKEDIQENSNWKGLKYRATSLSIEILHKDKSSMFKAFSSSRSAGRSFTANLLFLDEWAFQQFAREIWGSAYPTINRPTGGKVIGVSTIDRGTLFEEIFTEENAFNKVFMPWYSDPRRNKEWYENTKKDLGDLITQEYPATIEEALTIPGGSFFPEYKEDTHNQVREITKDDSIFYSLDYGLDMLSVGFFAMNRKGYVLAFDEIDESNLVASDAARLCYNRGIRRAFAPPDLWNRNRDTGKSTAEIFLENGVLLIRVDNTLEQGCINTKEYLKIIDVKDEQTSKIYQTARLQIDKNKCPTLDRCLKKIQKDKNRPNVYAKEPHDLTHSVDKLRYFCNGRPVVQLEPTKENKKVNWNFEKDTVDNDITIV